jgi:hypothetical protein
MKGDKPVVLRITDNLVIMADDCQYVVGKPRNWTNKAGKAVVVIGSDRKYFTDLSSAAKWAINKTMRDKVRSNVITELRDFAAEQKRMLDEFAELLKPLEKVR